MMVRYDKIYVVILERMLNRFDFDLRIITSEEKCHLRQTLQFVLFTLRISDSYYVIYHFSSKYLLPDLPETNLAQRPVAIAQIKNTTPVNKTVTTQKQANACSRLGEMLRSLSKTGSVRTVYQS